MYIYGSGGHAKVIIDTLNRTGRQVDGLYDDNPDGSPLKGRYPFLDRWIDRYDPEMECVVAVGDCAARKRIVSLGELNWGTVIDPDASISESAIIGSGSVVMRGVCVNADAKTGRHVILNTHCSIDHDCLLEDFVHIAPMAALTGGVHVGEGTFIGAGACVIPGVRIGRWAVVGAGAVVLNDVPDRAVVVGNPAKIIKFVSE